MSAIDDYLKNSATPTQRTELERVRKIVTSMVPDAEETISYGIPTLKYKGTHLFYFAAFAHHMSVFPGGALADELKEKLHTFKVRKGTIQFTEANPLPESIIREIVASRLQTINQR